MDDGLKQRLVGAIVLVAIAVLFLPSLFNRDSRRVVDLSSEIPSGPPVTTRLLEVPEPKQPQNIPAAKPLAENYPHEEAVSAVPSSPEDGDTSDFPESKPAPDIDSTSQGQTPPEPETAETAEAELNAQGVPRAWSLQVGSFESGERAVALLERLQGAGYKSYIREGISTQGVVHRVFAGPKINKAMAQSEKRAIDEQFGTAALIVEFKP